MLQHGGPLVTWFDTCSPSQRSNPLYLVAFVILQQDLMGLRGAPMGLAKVLMEHGGKLFPRQHRPPWGVEQGEIDAQSALLV